VVNVRFPERVDASQPVAHRITFELLDLPTEIPVSVAITSNRVFPADQDLVRTSNRIRERSPSLNPEPVHAIQTPGESAVQSATAAPAPSESQTVGNSETTERAPSDIALAAAAPQLSTAVTSEGSGRDRSREREEYFRSLRAAVEQHREYPRTARRARLQGTVVIRLSVSRSGRLLAVSVTQSSGEEVLDNAALSAVRMTGTFPPTPAAFEREQVTVELPFVFRLK